MSGEARTGERPELNARRLIFVSLGLLIGSTVLAILTLHTEVPQQPLPVTLAAVAGTAAWVLGGIRLLARFRQPGPASAVFVIGYVVLSGLLIWCNPFFGFFAWSGYLFIVHTLSERWLMAGVSGVALVTALSQTGGFETLQDTGGRVFFAGLFLANAVLAFIMTRFQLGQLRNSQRRLAVIDELAQANAKLEAALKENAGLHAQLLVQAHEAGVLDERQRMAGEIHDVLAQGLTGIVTQLEAAEAQPGERDRHLGAAKRLARESLAEARRSVRALRPQQLDGAGLPAALGEVVETWASLHDIRADLIITGTERRLLPEIEATLLRTAQEALANVARHAGAGRVGLTLSYMEDLVTLDVRDDGAGFDPEEPREITETGGFGLAAMRERLTRIAGTLAVESEPGAGTALSACVPAIALGGTP
ncbi:sensor histidine kinase [Actinoplanes regularis]|uniref:Oxygen sensor histidine kinase NreB n=1 Tax=Actinoplanes regularis TaxID=52697 RepID=A0A239EJE5_9ACTN|nr:sensor histidine kinase [Actinoplanes regularis]GIE89109.1 histidine kinase [Actinoplanes regularis]SNS44521.1 Signal transduction histidine kinase [Actinoplanes regularis]